MKITREEEKSGKEISERGKKPAVKKVRRETQNRNATEEKRLTAHRGKALSGNKGDSWDLIVFGNSKGTRV